MVLKGANDRNVVACGSMLSITRMGERYLDGQNQSGVASATAHSDSVADAEGSMFLSLRAYPAFRYLWTGTLATNSAFWMYQIAVGWLALQMTDSPFFVGLTGFAGGIPILFFALPSGVIVDSRSTHILLAHRLA